MKPFRGEVPSGWLTKTPTSEWETKRQRGVQKAIAAGKKLGRPVRAFNVEQARELRTAGASWAEIAQALDVPLGTIRGALKRHEVSQ